MAKRTYLAFLIVGLVILSGVGLFLWQQSSAPKEAPKAVDLGPAAATIVRTNQGYEPADVTIKKGEVVTWKNQSDEFHWPASDLHPTHGIYPEFDPLKPIAPGEDWSFKFDRVGTWKFHDHIRANIVGSVTVTE